MQLERRPRRRQVLDRREALAVHRVVQHEMTLAERAALGVLSGEPDRRPLDQERGERECLGVRPLDRALRQGAAAALELFLELGIDAEPRRYDEQLLVQPRQHRGCDGRIRLRDQLLRTGDPLRLLPHAGLGKVRLQRLLDLAQPLVEPLRLRVGLRHVEHALARELFGIAMPDGRRLLDPLVHEWLRVSRLVPLVVPVPPVAYHVDDDVAVELVAVHHREPHGREARLGVVGVHVDDRRIEALGEIARVIGRATFLRVGGEAHLVVGDQVDGATGRVALEARQVERLGHHALRRERRVAVDQQRQRDGPVVDRVLAAAVRLVRARPAFHHGVHRLEVTRVGRERDVHGPARRRLVDAIGAVVVLHVARAPLGGEGPLHVAPALELGEDRLVRQPDDVGQHVEAAAVRHPQHYPTSAAHAGELDRLVEHRHEDVQPLDREALLPEVRPVEEALQPLHCRQA